jgi:hypothetical protein
MKEHNVAPPHRQITPDDPAALLAAAMEAHPSLGSDDFVRTKVELGERLKVTRQTIHVWCKMDGAPVRADGRWSFQAWLEFLDAHDLASRCSIERTQALVEVVTCLADEFPARVSRKRLQRFKLAVRRTLRGMFPGTRFRPSNCETGRSN